MDYPLVTVFTLIYNTDPRYVIEAIESIRANNYPNLQHIIIDDCSPDIKPKQVVKSWIRENNYSCEFYEHKVNYGLCKTLNHVLELAKGEYLFGCSDDLITENRIRQDVETFLELNGDYAIV
ncbi:MAG: glycosyltransferase family 2 protein, partial [Chitinophagales bacterium]